MTGNARELIPVNMTRGLAVIAAASPVLFLPYVKAAERFFDLFTSNIRNKIRGLAYYKLPADSRTGVRTGATGTGRGEAAACGRLYWSLVVLFTS